MSITASSVKELREKTGAGMMDCKKALIEANGNFDAAVDWLRKKGHASAAKRAGRVASDGLVALAVDDNKGVVIEINSETDFVARNDKFQTLVEKTVNLALNHHSLETLTNAVQSEITELAAIIGENLTLRRFARVSVNKGIVASYVHNAVVNNAGKIAVLIGLESDADHAKLTALGKQLAMHIAASSPEALNIQDVDQSRLEKEKEIFKEQYEASGKPANIVEKMVEGRIKKYYQETVLLEQAFIMDNKTPVKDVIANFSKEAGTAVKITSFIRYGLGEGVTKTSEE